MLVAYLRGLLLPDYPNGVRSVVRENLVLESLNREMGARAIFERASVESGFASLMNPNQANKLLKHHNKMLSLAYDKFSHVVNKNNELANYDVSDLSKFIKVYKDLEVKGMLTPNAIQQPPQK